MEAPVCVLFKFFLLEILNPQRCILRNDDYKQIAGTTILHCMVIMYTHRISLLRKKVKQLYAGHEKVYQDNPRKSPNL